MLSHLMKTKILNAGKQDDTISLKLGYNTPQLIIHSHCIISQSKPCNSCNLCS
jgi:hypothetical protein